MSQKNIDMLHGDPLPKRGDILQGVIRGTNGRRMGRTWFVLAVHALKPIRGVPRARLWVERWWEIEPELRMRLFRSAERNGGQSVIYFERYPSKKKLSFEQLMARG